MSITSTQAVVLRAVKYGDGSLIVDMLTALHGRVSFMVRVSSSSRGRMRRQLFIPLTLVEVDFDYRLKSSLQRLGDIRMSKPLPSLSMHPYKLSMGMFLSEFLVHATRDDKSNCNCDI